MEIHAANGACQPRQCWGLAIPTAWTVTLARLCSSDRRSLYPARSRADAVEETGKAGLSIRRIAGRYHRVISLRNEGRFDLLLDVRPPTNRMPSNMTTDQLTMTYSEKGPCHFSSSVC